MAYRSVRYLARGPDIGSIARCSHVAGRLDLEMSAKRLRSLRNQPMTSVAAMEFARERY